MDGNTAYDSQNVNTNKIVNIYQDFLWYRTFLCPINEDGLSTWGGRRKSMQHIMHIIKRHKSIQM